jgi:hypothetical protein
LTSLTVDECEALLGPFEGAFLEYMAAWTLLGQCRPSRKYTTYKHCPLPTPADRLLFILVYLTQHTLQTLHGRVFGMRQSKANHWMHVVLPVLRHTLRTVGDAPCRTIEALRQRLGVEVPPLALASAASAAPPAAAPLFVMTVPSAPSRAPKLQLPRKHAIAARKSAPCCKTSC